MRRDVHRSGRCAGRVGVLSTAALLGLALPVSGQSSETAATLVGVLVDATNGARLPETMVTLVEEDRRTLSDAHGLFRFEDVPLGQHEINFRQYGYEERVAFVQLAHQRHELLRFELRPNPLLVDGVTAVIDRLQEAKRRLENRRRAVPVSVRAFDQRRMVQTTARDMFDFLRLDVGLSRTECGYRRLGDVCYLVRGRAATPTVYIDEAPLIGGVTMLEMYRPYELYSVEVYQGGRQIRAYTHQFMERMARRPIALIPIYLP